MDILSHFDEDGCLEVVNIREAGIDLDSALDELGSLEREGIVYEEKQLDSILRPTRWVGSTSEFNTTRAWMLTELGKIYIGTL